MELVILILLIAINGFFALAEIAFVSSRRESIESSESQGHKSAALVLKMMDAPDRFLSVIQVGITLIGIVSGTFSGVALAEDFANVIDKISFLSKYSHSIALVVVVTVVTYFSIVFGELVPKSIALRDPEKFILALIRPISVFAHVMGSIVSFLSWSTKLIMNILHIKTGGIDEESDPIKEILGIAKIATIKNKIDPLQEKIIKNAISTRKLLVKDIMVQKNDMRTLTTEMSPADALIAAHVHHHTRYPLIDSSKNGQVIGYVNFKDIVNTLRLNPLSPTLEGIKRPIASVNHKEKVTDVLKNLIRTHQHIAMVKNEQGQDTGLVTMENILETIVGDIMDEYDVLPEYLYEINETRLLAGGGVNLLTLRERLGNTIPEANKTLCQWILDMSNKPVKIESKIILNGIVFEIRKMSRSRISEIIIDFSGITIPQPENEDNV